MRTLTLFTTAIALVAGPASAGVFKVPIKRIIPPSDSDSIKTAPPCKGTPHEGLGVAVPVGDQEILTEHYLTPTGHRLPVHHTSDSQYACTISIGAPPRELEVVLDTGSSRLWLPDVQCEHGDPASPICRDVLRIGGLTVKSQRFAGASAVPGFHISLDGFLGLGYVPSSGKSTDSPFFNMVHQGLLDEPVFALYLGESDQKESEIVFGGMNSDHYHCDPVYLPIRRESYWEVDLDFISVDDETIQLDATGAIFDSGTSFITLPETLAQIMHREIGARRSDNGQFVVDCNKLDSLPDLSLTLAGHNFTLGPSDYILQAESSCVSLFMGLDLPPPRGPVAILGAPFLKKWYSIYDLGKDAIGLARAK